MSDSSKIFCVLDSNDELDTNLQLYSLYQAWMAWNKLLAKKDILPIGKQRERFVYILVQSGTSLSQLMGQNFADHSKGDVDDPCQMVLRFIKTAVKNRDCKKLLIQEANDFFATYNACRHFGKNKDDENHMIVIALDLDKVRKHMNFVFGIWNRMISHFRHGGADIDSGFDGIESMLSKYHDD